MTDDVKVTLEDSERACRMIHDGPLDEDGYAYELAKHRLASQPQWCADMEAAKWQLGDRLTKKSGAAWTGKVVGFYRTDLTAIGYAIESENEPGSVQIYPERALITAPTPPEAE